jgi:hypothetical protein
MLLVAAGATQALLLSDLLLRRILFLFLPGRRSGLKRFADNAALTSFAAALLQTATLPVLALASVVNTLGRSLSLIALAFVVFGALLVISTSAVYAYTVLARIYNVGVAPVVMATQWLFVLLDFVFRAVVPLYNGAAFMASEILRRLVLPYSFHNIETLPEIMQGVSLALVTLGLSVTSWLKNVVECTVLYESAGRFCGVVGNMTASKLDCAGIFTAVHTQCFAAPNHLTVDLLTPGLFARQAVLSLRRVIASHCGVAALVLNLLLFPLADHRLYAAVHSGVNTALFGVIGLPVTTVRRCEALKLARAGDRASAGDFRAGVSRAHELVACTPDWEPLVLMASSTLDNVGEVIDGWLNAAAMLARDRIGAESGEGGSSASRCNEGVRMSSIVLDAARAIEGHESVEALERLQSRGGLPDGETLTRVRVAGLTPKLFGVTDGKAVLYRSAHDGYVWAFGAWPFAVDVRLGLAAVSYSGSATETDTTGDTRTGLLGCRCVKDGGLKLLCATAPYVAHVDDGLAGLNASAVHVVSFPELSLLGMSCDNTAVRVLPLRWPRRRLATAEGNGGSGYAGYQRFSYLNTAQRLKGDTDTTDNLRLLAHKYTATQAGAVEAAVFVQPLCGGGFNPACWRAARNCYPWCMGVVRGGVRAQNITMYSAQRWEDHVMLPDVDCGVERNREQILSGQCVKDTASAAVLDLMSQEGVMYGECRAARMCTPSPVPAAVMSLVPLLNRDARLNGTELGLVVEHKNSTWLSVRTQEQPFVVAGDVMLGVTQDTTGQPQAVVVTRLYDIGHGSLQMGSERLTLTSNFHAIQIARCSTLADTSCYANSMAQGRIVLPQAVHQVYTSEYRSQADGGEPPGLLPAAASRWAVHWAENPDLAVYRVRFKFCNGEAAFGINLRSSFGRARVWTLQTMRGVDMEAAGAPSEEEVRSRVSYMRVPEFYGDFFADEGTALNQCGVVFGLKIVGVEYMNPQNVLVTVLAARPRDYDPDTDTVNGPRTYRYYFLHPSRHDCRDVDEQEAVDGDQNIFSCWRAHDKGMWPDDGMLAGRSWGATPPDQALLATGDAPCTEARLVPAFGSALVVPLNAILSLVQTLLDAVCTLTAAVAADPTNPLQAVRDLSTVDLERATFHSMTDSAGARLLRVDDILAAVAWCARFNAHLMIYAVNAFSSVTSTLASSKKADKLLSGLRTVVVGAAKVAEGGPGDIPGFQGVEAMFEQPIAFSSVYASTAVLGMADGLQQGMRLPAFVSAFVRAQAGMVGSLSLVMRMGRVVLLRVLQAGGASPAAVASSALLESQSIVKADLLDTMRFQCYGLAQMVGADRAWGQALRHLCLLFPDTLEGVMTVVTVLVLDYPTVSCACKLSDGEMRGGAGDTVLDAVTRICLLRPLPVEEMQWLVALARNQEDKREICFITMDRANARLASAFDKAYLRLRHMTEYVEGIVDSLLALVTGDGVACDAFDVSPYVVSIIPEPVDYFSACVDTEDCRVKCLEEYAAFDSAKQFEESRGVELGLQTDVRVDLESMLFSAQDIEDGKNKPPFMILDVTEIPRRSCALVCGGVYSLGNRCLLLAGLRTVDSAHGTQQWLATAYYCLPIDITQYAFQWPGMEAETMQAPDSAEGYPSLPLSDNVRSVHVASSWCPQFGTRDMLLVMVRSPDDSVAEQSDLLDEGVTKVQLVVAGQPTPFEVMRTSMRSERMQQAGVTRSAKGGYLHKIEHLQVDVADNRRSFIAVQARGYVMELKNMEGTELQSWELPRKACVRCEISFEGADFLPSIVCTTVCVNEHTGRDATEHDFVLQHKRVCLRALGGEEDETQNALRMCEEFMALSSISTVEKALYFQTVSSGTAVQSKMSIPDSVLSLLRVDAIARSYIDVDNKIHARTTLLARVVYVEPRTLARLRVLARNESAVDEATAGTMVLEVPTANARDVHGGWLQILNLQVSESGVSGRMRIGMQTSTVSHVLMNCSVHNCGACVRRANGEVDEDLFSLQNMCYAAQQCGVERCAGTLVNMRKPLCNLGKVLSAELHGIRVLLKGVWIVITDKITMTVELTHQRREEYEMRWPDTALRQQTCTAKDNIVSMAATLTSVLGAVSHLMRDVSQQNSNFGSHVDSRVHARHIMMLTATTNLLTSVMLYPVYQQIVFQKFVSCTASDVSYSISEVVATAQERGQPELTINFGGSMQQAAERAQIAVCLSEDVRQSLMDTGSRIPDIDSQQASNRPRDARKITRLITDAISSTVDVALRSYVQYTTNIYDIVLTWASGIIKGMMDVAQTIDWERCKLPVVDNGLESLGQCACGDEAYSIPAEQQSRDWTSHGFWCSGLLMLNEGDGSDLLVWNPFSLQTLLNIKGTTGNGYDDYVTCLRDKWPSECEPLKPRDNRLSQQGVEVMQVISRCRENYQQKRWDEAATLYALFAAEELRRGDLRRSASMQEDDKFTLLRKKVVKLVENDRRFWTSSQNALDLSPSSWVCLADALAAGNLRHNCHVTVDSTFSYVRATNNLPSSVDACKVPANIRGKSFPRFLWTGSSTNHVPLTNMHSMNVPQDERERIAEAKIEKMIAEEIKPIVEKMLMSSFTEKLKDDIDVEAFSVEGDELHQLIDCIVLGPYAAASLSASVHLENLPSLPVPLYHRGSALSRKFSSWGQTGGSPARKAFMHIVRRHVETQATETVATEVRDHMQDIAKIWLDKRNYLCTCPNDPVPKIKCCSKVRRENLDFGVKNAFGRRNWEISHQVITAVFQDVSQSNTINQKWLEQIGEAVRLNEDQRSILSAAQLFAPAGNVPVRTYGTQDSLGLLNNESLWEWCTSRVTGLFATMPLTGEDVNRNHGRGARSSIPDVPVDELGDPYMYDPARDRDGAPARDHFDARNHAMELVVDKLLVRSRAFAPHFWTHAHRYVASDSVWCESEQHVQTAAPEIQTPSSIKTQTLRQESVLAPDIDQLLYPADVLKACACGWKEAEGACYLPAEVCAHGREKLTDASLADGQSKREAWAKLCEGENATRATYDRTGGDLLVVLQVLQDLDATVLRNCTARQLSIAWGLLAPEQAEAWYAGEPASERPGGSWNVSAQHLATAGPGGLRLGMLSPSAPQTMQEYASEFELGERSGRLVNAFYRHTVAQPVCNGTLHKLLREELDEYFVNALLPMAHSVQIVPAVEYCVRWTIEYALLSVLRLLLQETPESDQDTRDRFLLLVSRQQTAANVWRDRCSTQAQDVALCVLRGVYDIVPESKQKPPLSCAFAGHAVSGCREFYYTSACLLYCDGVFYDPCMCENQRKDSECSALDFTPRTCTAGEIVDGRRLFADLGKTEDLLTNSLHWPSNILSGEARDAEHEQQLQDALQGALAFAKHEVDLSAVFESATALLLDRDDEESVPESYCDDLMDYWPDVQHPVGYHPTPACSAAETRTRGFGSWMSETLNGSDTLIDPVRMRNMTAASRVFGAANLVCDAHTYAAPGHRLNPYYMQSKWNLRAPADPSIPRKAPRLEKEEMNFPGLPSFDETDTTMRREGHASDPLLHHSVGLVRAWARWYSDTDAHSGPSAGAMEDAQGLLDHAWPHWLLQATAVDGERAEVTGYFLTDAGMPQGCGFPELDVCTSDSECEYGRNRNSPKLVCLKHLDTAGASQTGVCMQLGTCFQHQHCLNSSSGEHKLCSGEGRCMSPTIRVRNEASVNAEVQLFAERECDVSMQRLSLFESVTDFAKANGMCTFRNWYHYRNTTDNRPGFQYIKEVPDSLVFRTDEPEARMLSDLNVLRHQPHACDRSYAHTEYKACYAQDYRARLETPKGSSLAKSVDITRTWVRRDSEWHARFCDLKGGGDVTGFLSPYKQSSVTLHSAPQDIRRCADFRLCPTLMFHIRGKGVDRRRVRVYEKSVDSPFGVKANPTLARDYCALDAQRCWGAGYMLGTDCADVNREESSLCIPDQLVLPLVTIVFGDATSLTEEQAKTKLSVLRQSCVHAFGEGLSDSGKRGQELFRDVFDHLTTPYKWTDTERLLKVQRYASGLLWFVFGMDAEGGSGKRGFDSIKRYLEHSDCLVYLAKKLLENEQVMDLQVNAEADLYPSSYEQRLVPGASLYIFERRVPVAISFRWFTQCVVLANANEGGVIARFLAHIVEGEHTDTDTVQCDNYLRGLKYMQHVDEAPLPLKKWLQTAPFLFEQMDFVDSNSEIQTVQMHATQISRDVINTISWAVGQLPVFDIPDLVCISAADNDLAGRLSGQKNIFDSELERHQSPGVIFDKPGSFLTMLTDSKNVSIYKQVLDYLTSGKINWDFENPTITLQTLLDAKVVEDLQKNVLTEVTPNDVFPMYDYVRLRPSEMLSFYRSFTESTFSEDDYLYDNTMSANCKCAESKDQECRRLRKPEYSLHTPMRCSFSNVLPCSDPVRYLLDERAPEDNKCVDEKKPCQFLQQQELLYLVLLILDKEITNTVSGGFMALHKIREPDASRAVDLLFHDSLSDDLPHLSLAQAKQFNSFVQERSVMNLKCPENEFNYQKLTNQMHKTMQSCQTDLKEPVGWNVPPRNAGTLALQPRVNSLLHGFYPAFVLRDRDVNRTFLDELLFTDWHLEAHGHRFIHSICYEEDDEVNVIAPFWAEFFDVATNFGREDSASDPPLACDMKRSGSDSRLMFYNTLCAADAEGVQSCAQHPVYEDYVKNVLPAVCEQKHGQPVVRSRLGALDGTPLCEKTPKMPDICSFKHGSLFGHTGEAVPDLDGGASPVPVDVQSGLWDKSNFIFRGRYGPMATGRVPALRLRPQDIGGHCLEFAISPSAYLYLDKVLLTSNCKQDGGRVRDWLQNIEQDWAWEHSLAQKVMAEQDVSESSRPSWRCPLHWLGQFHDDEHKHQARGPSWRRNRERFAHITGSFQFAHPTIRNAYRLRGVRAASFVSDTIACVAADSGDCHSKQYLSDTLERMLSKEEWHVVQYVTNRPDLECDRVLDWPSDCGSSTRTGLPGACTVRQ